MFFHNTRWIAQMSSQRGGMKRNHFKLVCLLKQQMSSSIIWIPLYLIVSLVSYNASDDDTTTQRIVDLLHRAESRVLKDWLLIITTKPQISNFYYLCSNLPWKYSLNYNCDGGKVLFKQSCSQCQQSFED